MSDSKERTMEVFCVNTGECIKAEMGLPLSEFRKRAGVECIEDGRTGVKYEILAALVDNCLKDLNFPLVFSHKVEFIGLNHPDGRRTYNRSLCFVLQAAVRELFEDKYLCVEHSLPGGLYCEIKEVVPNARGRHTEYFVGDEDIDRIKARMDELIAADLPFEKEKVTVKEAEKVFYANHQPEKAALLHSLGRFSCSIYHLGNETDSFHGPLVPSTGCLRLYDVSPFNEGFCLRTPDMSDTGRVTAMKGQSKIAATLKEYSDWCDVLGASGIGSLNKAILEGNAVKIINISEAFHERRYSAIADQIYAVSHRVKTVFIAGPSSSGKTSSSLRLALQLQVLGLNPKVIELDNYFVDRERTPKDENGEYDFEALGAMDLELLNSQLNTLFAGGEVELPQYDFKTGSSLMSGKKMRLGEKDILIMEGIHALNPEMVPEVDQSKVFRVYVSALTSLNVDENNNISTSDNRLLRRMVRDNRVRGITPEETIQRWRSVRQGEARNIFPFQENADAIFNSALLYELPMLKYFAEPLLRRIQPSSSAYSEAVRMQKFLDYIVALSPAEISVIPPTSIMREFIGRQTL